MCADTGSGLSLGKNKIRKLHHNTTHSFFSVVIHTLISGHQHRRHVAREYTCTRQLGPPRPHLSSRRRNLLRVLFSFQLFIPCRFASVLCHKQFWYCWKSNPTLNLKNLSLPCGTTHHSMKVCSIPFSAQIDNNAVIGGIKLCFMP